MPFSWVLYVGEVTVEKPILKDTEGLLSFKLQKAIAPFRIVEWTSREECRRDTKK